MTNGLDVLIGWAALAVLVGLLVWVVLRRTNGDPFGELRRTDSDTDPPAETVRGE